MCDCSEDCKDYAKRSIVKKPECVIKRRLRERARRTKKKRQIIDYLGGECVDCGMKAAVVDSLMRIGGVTFAPACAFDVEHTNWKKKTNNLSYMNTYSWEKIKEELDNCECVLVCRICHSIRSKKLINEDKEFIEKQRKKRITKWKNKWHEAPQPLNSTSA